MTYSEDYRKRHYNPDHTVKNGRLQTDGLMLRSGEEDTITGQNNYGVLNTTFSFGVRLDQNKPVQMLSYKSVDLEALYFSKGLTSDGKEVVNTKGTNAPVVRRLVAENDSTGYLTLPNSAISGVASSDWCLAFCINPTTLGDSHQILGTFDTTGTTNRFYIVSDNGQLRYRIGTGGSEDITDVGFLATDTNWLIMMCYNNTTGKITTKIKNLDTGIVTDGAEYTVARLTELNDNDVALFKNAGGLANSFIGKIWGLRIWFSTQTFENMASLKYSTGCNAYLELEGSLYDKSGNDYHATEVNTVDMTATTTNTDGLYSYLLNEGFDHYTDDATGLIDLYVPYVSGSPVVSSVASYTKQSSNPATKGFNQAPVKVVIGTSGHNGTGYVAEPWLVALDTDENFYTAGATNYCKELDYDDLVAITSDYVLFNIANNSLQNLALYDPAGFASDSFNVSVAGDLLNIYCKSDIHSVVLDDFMADMNVTLVFDFDDYELEVYVNGILKDTFTLVPSFTLTSTSDLKLGTTNTDFDGKQLIKYLEIRDGKLTGTEVAQLTAELESLKFPSKPYGKVKAFPAIGNKNYNEIKDGDMEAMGTSAWMNASGTPSKVPATLVGGGTQAMRLTGSGPINQVLQSVLTAGKTYRFTGWFRGDGVAQPRVYLGSGNYVKIGSSSSSWQYFDEVITVSSAFFSIMCYNLSGVTHSAEFDNILIQEVGKTYLDVFHKSDWGITANETAITSGLIENTIYEVLTGSFKVVMDTYNGHDVKVIECVSTGTIQLPALVGGTVWGCYTDTGSGYVYEEGPASITADVLSMTAGDKIILGDIRGDYAIRRI